MNSWLPINIQLSKVCICRVTIQECISAQRIWEKNLCAGGERENLFFLLFYLILFILKIYRSPCSLLTKLIENSYQSHVLCENSPVAKGVWKLTRHLLSIEQGCAPQLDQDTNQGEFSEPNYKHGYSHTRELWFSVGKSSPIDISKYNVL